jgi:MFS family permease
VLVAFSYLVRKKLHESPMFAEIKSRGTISKNPLKDSFANAENRNKVLISLFGACAGQGVVWYTSQFYALYFIQTILNFQGVAANKIMAIALLLGTPFFVVFGALSDRIGRKKLIMTGLFLATVGYLPIYAAMKQVGTVHGTPAVSINDNLNVKTNTREVFRLEVIRQADGATQTVRTSMDPDNSSKPLAKEKPKTEVSPSRSMFIALVALVWLQVIFATLVYGPIAAFLVELFPTRIRYTSMSLPYHIGNGIFGGLVPLIGTAVVASTGNPLSGVYYPIAIALITLIVGMVAIKETPTAEGFAETA